MGTPTCPYLSECRKDVTYDTGSHFHGTLHSGERSRAGSPLDLENLTQTAPQLPLHSSPLPVLCPVSALPDLPRAADQPVRLEDHAQGAELHWDGKLPGADERQGLLAGSGEHGSFCGHDGHN